MALYLGIDTGGTYTDAVVVDPARFDGSDDAQSRHGQIIAKSKALTTKHNLSIGISQAVDGVLDNLNAAQSAISLVSLSTTLATNALVEGQGAPIALVYIGFGESDIERAGLKQALDGDPVILLSGGHNTHGREQHPLDLDHLAGELDKLTVKIDGFAVVGYFATRNPDHEIRVRDHIRSHTDIPVTCSHELSSRLNGPKRAVTTVLNARLIPLISNLVKTTRDYLQGKNIAAPVMVVRGDGALVSADFAIDRPIETILSGPAASIVGARWLTGLNNAIISDIGGTTTDIAVLQDGRPTLSRAGANVGGHQTMVEAVAMKTFGLGGDSEIRLVEDNKGPRLVPGPRRLVPLSLMGAEFGDLVHRELKAQNNCGLSGRHDGRFALVRNKHQLHAAEFSPAEWALIGELGPTPLPIGKIAQRGAQSKTLDRLVARGIITLCGFTPSDAMHVLGHHKAWDKSAAALGAELFARRKDRFGKALAPDAMTISREILDGMINASADAILQSAFAHDGLDDPQLTVHPLVKKALSTQNGLVQISLGLDRPLIGIGASAPQYLASAGERLGCTVEIPDHADVANAIGAVVGQVEVKIKISLSQPSPGQIGIHGTSITFSSVDEAFEHAEGIAREKALEKAQIAGADQVEVSVGHTRNQAEVEGQTMFIDGSVIAVARGRPALNSFTA